MKKGWGTRCSRNDLSGKDLSRFSPTTDMTDAMEAAEKAGLFDPAKGAAVLRQIGTAEGKVWDIEFYRVGFVKMELVEATAPFAICEAILAIEPKH